MPRVPDAAHPTTEQFAEDLYVLTPVAEWPAPFTGRTNVWEREPVEMREAFRARARRFMQGDLSVAPWARAAKITCDAVLQSPIIGDI